VDLGLEGRVYLVTGGSSGLGRATAAALAADGAKVVISSRSQEKVDAAVAGIGANAAGLAVDNADADAAERLTALALEKFGRVDGALVSVGGPPPGSTTKISDDAWKSAFEGIFLGAVRLTRHLAPLLDTGTGREDGGAIGYVLSSSAKTPLPGLSISNGLRAGLAMLAKDLADELGPQGTRVLSLLPGRILTDRTIALEKGDPEARKRSEAAIPLRRLGDPAEFGRVAAFLLSPAASYMTGSIVSIDGGLIRAL
jgi:3-oxoacyl-[acyl-carrier protein] reductase